MPKNYTPTASFPTATPARIPANGDVWSEALATDEVFQQIHDRLQFNNDKALFNEQIMANLQLKLDVAVSGTGDTALPVFANGFALSSGTPIAVKPAIEAVDAALFGEAAKIVNINTNVGGSVSGSTPPNYASTNFINNNDSHHVSIENLDTAAGVFDASITTLTADLATQTGRITNIVAKVGADADLAAAFTYTSQNYITNGDSYKTVAGILDSTNFGSKRNAESAYDFTVRNWAAANTNIEGSHFDTFINTAKASSPQTTATIDTNRQAASAPATGGDKLYYTTFTASAASVNGAFRLHASAAMTVEFNLIGSFLDANMTVIPTEDTFTPAAAAGTDVVIKVTIPDGEELYDIAFLAQS